jgi:1,4-dihydroxy-2-naphthoyl-CoA synthase
MSDPYARYTRLKFDRPHAKVLRITMENGRMNTADEALHAELGDIWRDVDRDASVHAVVLTGAGKVFSAGGDFAMIQQNIDDFASRARQWKEARDIVYNVINCSKPVVSAMRGVAVGAGLVCVCSPTYRSRRRIAGSSTGTPGSGSQRAITPQSSGLCYAGSPRRNIICCCAIRCSARRPNASG